MNQKCSKLASKTVHEIVKPFNYEICQKSFGGKGNLMER